MIFLEIAKIIIGAATLLFLPGFVISYVFFPKRKVDTAERMGLSFALSISVVPLVTFYLNLAGVKLTQINLIFEATEIIVIGLVVAWRLGRFSRTALAKTAPQATQKPKPVVRVPRRIQL